MGIYLSLGSNLGNKSNNINKAIDFLRKLPKIDVLKTSKIIETEPYGKTDQPNFLNCVVEISTTLTPHELLHQCLNIEKIMGRKRTEKWGPRIIDIDVLFYKDKVIRTTNLVIPHPEIEKRLFVLRPLSEIASNFIHPIKKKRIIDLYRLLKSKKQQ